MAIIGEYTFEELRGNDFKWVFGEAALTNNNVLAVVTGLTKVLYADAKCIDEPDSQIHAIKVTDTTGVAGSIDCQAPGALGTTGARTIAWYAFGY